MLLQGCGLLGWHLAMAFVGMSCMPGPGLSISQRVSAERDVPSTSWGAMVPAWALPRAQGSVSAMVPAQTWHWGSCECHGASMGTALCSGLCECHVDTGAAQPCWEEVWDNRAGPGTRAQPRGALSVGTWL